MSGRCNREDLEALVYGELSPERAADVESHADGCEECGVELAWLRTERAAMAERQRNEPELPEELWAGIESRIAQVETAAAEPERRGLLATLFPWRAGTASERARWFGFGLATAAAAAALMFVFLRGGDDPGRQVAVLPPDAGQGAVEPAPAIDDQGGDKLAEAEQALADAEAAHLAAIAALDAAYLEHRDELDPEVAARYDAQFAATRATIEGARAEAGDDIAARLRLLDAYAAHQRSMRSALTNMQETN